MALRGVGEASKDVPGCGNEQEGFGCGERMEFAEAMQAATEASCEEQVEDDDRYWENNADKALGEDIESTGSGEASAVEADVGWIGAVLVCAAEFFRPPDAVKSQVSQRQTMASGIVMREKRKIPKLESRMSAA